MIENNVATINGMHCASCSARIEKVVGTLAGVESCVVNLAAETVALAFDPAVTGLDMIAETIGNLGFELVVAEEVVEKEIHLDIKGMHCASCSARIEKVVGGLDGVVSCTVNLASEVCRLLIMPSKTRVRDIVEIIKGLGFEAVPQAGTQSLTGSEKQEEMRRRLAGMKKRLLPSFLLAMAVMVFSMGEMVFSYPESISSHSSPLTYALIQFFLVLPVLYLGRNFYLIGVPALLRRVPNMDSLIAVGTGAAFIYSTWNLVEIALGIDAMARAHDLYFESAAMLIALVSVGKYLEARSKTRASDAISKMMKLTPDTATLLEGGEPVSVLVDDIMIGDTLYVKPGERIPVDSIITKGKSAIDESMLTGESLPVKKGSGDEVYGGTLNKNGAITIKVLHVGTETMLSRIIKMVQDAQGSKAPIASMADRISLYFVPIVMVLAVIAGLSWFFIGGMGFSFSLRIFIAVLVIACPCAMGLATPTSIMVGTGRGAQLGVLVKNGEALEMAEKIDVVIFDKTGTLTHGKPTLTDCILFTSAFSEAELLSLVGAAESGSEHPLGEAIVSHVQKTTPLLATPQTFKALPGRGLEAEVDGRLIHFGNQDCMDENKVKGLNATVLEQADALAKQGKTALFLAVDRVFQAVIAVADSMKDEAPQVVRHLKELGVSVVMLTGDHIATANAIAAEVGVDRVIAQVLPTDKAQQVELLQAEGKRVAMVGDGINDAPALARADIGIAMGTGIDVAIESADIVLMTGHLTGVLTALSLSRATMVNIKQNLFWAFAYNVVGIPVAAGVLFVFGGPTLNPMLGGAAMALSSVSVVTNALRLRFFQPPIQ